MLIKNILIPSVRPEVTLIAPFFENKFSNRGIQILAKPYFFNVQNEGELEFSWKVNDRPAAKNEKSNQLSVVLNQEVAPNFELKTTLNVSNPRKFTERASREIKLTFVK